VLVGDALDPYSIALDFFSGKAVPCRPTAVRCHPQGTGEGQLGGAGLGAGILRYPISAYRRRKSLAPQGPGKLPKLAVAGGPTEGQPQRLVISMVERVITLGKRSTS
jgi:hypothetical protein